MLLRRALTLAAVAATAVAALLLTASGHGSRPSMATVADPAAWQGLVGGLDRQVPLGQRMIVLLNAPSLADRVAAAGGVATDDQERHWTASAAAAQQQLLLELAAQGVRARPDYRYIRLINGFSAALDARAVSLLERAPQVRGVYPVRPAYPASVTTTLLQQEVTRLGVSLRPSVGIAGFDGNGVTIALLDTGVDRASPYLHGHVLPGVDVIGNGSAAAGARLPGRGSRLEVHGTENAGLIVGLGGPAGLGGVASAATVLPIRVAGWQLDGQGSFAVFARTDQILAGLEWAVDPNQDGDAHDAARIALVPLAQPFGGFPDSPLSRAIRGALRLDMLVVAAAGNDGPAGPVFGSIGDPGGSPAALTVGAVDLRPRVLGVSLEVRVGLDTLLRRRVELAGAAVPPHPLRLALVSTSSVRGLVDGQGYSRVAGKAVLVPSGDAPRETASAAIDAGAALVLLAGAALPPGALGLDDHLRAPVVAVPPWLVAEVRKARSNGLTVAVSMGSIRADRNALLGHVAAFSSSGLAYGGEVKPDLVAPGVGLATADPGISSDGRSNFALESGSSAAAAVVAGAAAAILEARPDLTAAELQSALVGSASPVAGQPLQAQGTGLLDTGAAAAAEIVTLPASLSFGRYGGDAWGSRELVVRNLSSRRLTIYVGRPRQLRGPGVKLAVQPRRLDLAAGQSAPVEVRAAVVGAPRARAAVGTLSVAAVDGPTLRVPWSVILDRGPDRLLGPLSLTRSSFRPSEAAPSLLSLQIGRVGRTPAGGTLVEPAQRLDLQLWSGTGRFLGLLARVPDVLPGTYAFGVTGHGPKGKPLTPGPYRLRLVAWPAGGGRPSARSVQFRID